MPALLPVMQNTGHRTISPSKRDPCRVSDMKCKPDIAMGIIQKSGFVE
jgi:hypothetical protein